LRHRPGHSVATVLIGVSDFSEGGTTYGCPNAQISWKMKKHVVKASLPYSCGFKPYFEAYDGSPAFYGHLFKPRMFRTSTYSGKSKDTVGKLY
jgi:hypothetical protein